MQRIIPFGTGYAQSAEFSVDEGQTIRFWLVREDYTTTPGHHAYAELQIKSAVGNDRWTTLHEMTGDEAYYDLIGVDESLTYRWVRKDAVPSIAIDRAQDGDYSRTLRAPVNLGQPDFGHATLPLLFKVQSGTDGAGTFGFYDVMSPVDPSGFGRVFDPVPDLPINSPDSVTYISASYNPTSDTIGIYFHNDNGDDTSDINWAEYIGGYVYLYTECPDPSTPVVHAQQLVAAATPGAPVAGEAYAFATGLDISLLLDGDGNLDGIDPLRFFAEGSTFFVALRKPGQNAPVFNLGPPTGRFTLDQNDTPARLSASPFDTAGEYVALSAVEQPGVVIPLTYDEAGDPIRLQSTFRVFTMIAPGEYEWERSCNSAPGVWLNTGWRA